MPEIKDAPAKSPNAQATSGEGFDLIIERLRGVVEKLEAGSLGLEDSLAAFEDGVRLSRRGAEILDRAEERVELLTRGEGGESVVPFPAVQEKGESGHGDGT